MSLILSWEKFELVGIDIGRFRWWNRISGDQRLTPAVWWRPGNSPDGQLTLGPATARRSSSLDLGLGDRPGFGHNPRIVEMYTRNRLDQDVLLLFIQRGGCFFIPEPIDRRTCGPVDRQGRFSPCRAGGADVNLPGGTGVKKPPSPRPPTHATPATDPLSIPRPGGGVGGATPPATCPWLVHPAGTRSKDALEETRRPSWTTTRRARRERVTIALQHLRCCRLGPSVKSGI